VGLELLGPPGSEALLLRAGASLLRAVQPEINPRPRPGLPG